jgi:haloalkane dehalogenase
MGVMGASQEISAAFPYESKFLEVHGSKMHYIDEGEGDTILFLHGNPHWSYVWRNIIPYVSDCARCIAVDLIGFGKSDNPDIGYRFFDQVKYVEGFIEKMGLKNITIFSLDWGSAYEFHYAMRHEDNMKALVFMEAIVMPLTWDMWRNETKALFKCFRTPDVGWDMIVNDNAFIENVLPHHVERKLTEEELRNYHAPFENPEHRKPSWAMPNDIPLDGEPADVHEVVAAYNARLQESDLPKLMFYATPGALQRAPVVQWCKDHLKNLTWVHVGQGRHALQEDHPHLIGTELAKWYTSL